MIIQDGLEWRDETFGPEPAWTKEPNAESLEAVVRPCLDVSPSQFCRIRFLAQGCFNKLYTVDLDGVRAILRVALPVDPYHKTISEVATIDFVDRNTDIPVPKVFAFDASHQNDIGFEWILMQRMPGQPLRKAWRKLSLQAKENLIKQLAYYQSQLFSHKFEKIGNLFKTQSQSEESKERLVSFTSTELALKRAEDTATPKFHLGRIVSNVFFWGDHVMQSVPRGPFKTSHEWLRARLQLVLADQERILKNSNDANESEEAKETNNLVRRLLGMLPHILPSNRQELTVLFHDDLSMQNILVDDSGSLTAIIDWECVSALPLWRACQYPAFLEGRRRNEKPKREFYAAADPEEEEEAKAQGLDNEALNPLYWEHVLEFERIHLRQVFLSAMERFAPMWVEHHRTAALKADFEFAVCNADNEFCTSHIRAWLDSYFDGGGQAWSLRDRANSGVGYAAAKVIASASAEYHVILTSRSLEKGNAAISEIQSAGVKGSLSLIQLDVTSEQSISAAASHVSEKFGRLDVLVNNAGVSSKNPSLKKKFEETYAANVIGPVLMTAAFEPLLLKSKRPYLMHISSGLGSLELAATPTSHQSKVSLPAYNSSKSALNMIMIDDHRRLGKHGVKVSSVCPGLVRSNLRGTEEEQISAGGIAVDATVSGELILSVIEGKRDAEVGQFIKQDGTWPW
ncbi:MAG: hypothetical protein Q9160_006419 [Pyrenula sp. 1 TL-2023]